MLMSHDSVEISNIMQVDVLVFISVYLQFWNVPETLTDDLQVVGTRDFKNSD